MKIFTVLVPLLGLVSFSASLLAAQDNDDLQTIMAVLPSVPPPVTANLSRQSCSCGQKSIKNRIVGGEPAQLGEFPWRVNLFIGSRSRGVGCAGTIIHSRWILTAAHCYDGSEGSTTYVGAGTLGIGTPLVAKRYIRHEGYNRRNLNNDLTLVEMREDFDFSHPNIGPACLPYKYAGKTEMTGKVVGSGWGDTSEDGSSSPVLLKVVLDLIQNSVCSSWLSKQLMNQACAYAPGKDTCQGDSGGSIDFEDGGKWFAFGVVSWGHGCARPFSPGVYARVSEYTQWIEDNTGATFCKM